MIASLLPIPSSSDPPRIVDASSLPRLDTKASPAINPKADPALRHAPLGNMPVRRREHKKKISEMSRGFQGGIAPGLVEKPVVRGSSDFSEPQTLERSMIKISLCFISKRRPNKDDCDGAMPHDPRGFPASRRKSMIRRRFLAVGPYWFAAGMVLSDSEARAGSGDPRFPASIASQIGGKDVRLVLTGSAMRKKYGFSVYSIASYVREGVKISDAGGLAKADIAKQLHLIFERDVDGQTIATSFRGSIGANHPAPAFSVELAKLERYFLSHDARQGDHVWLTHVPAVGLGCRVAGQPGVVIEGVRFAQAAWDAYLGPNNLGVAIKEGLTSRLR
jgi:Chalcone isomerase-like